MRMRGTVWWWALSLAMMTTATRAAEDPAWLTTARRTTPGTFPMMAPFEASFRFGWSGLGSDIEAARATAKLSIQDSLATVDMMGGTTGAARFLWRLDATHQARFSVPDLKPLDFSQTERYSNRSITTEVAFKPDGVWRLRKGKPDRGKPARWKPIRIEPVYDLVTALFLARSQPLEIGQRFSFVAFPGDSPFLAEVTVLKRDTLILKGKTVPTLRMTFQIQRITLSKSSPPTLERHKKFRSGTGWVSDDQDRLPLRVEAEIFIGSVFGELESFSWSEGR